LHGPIYTQFGGVYPALSGWLMFFKLIFG
jgi:hypothetical protein